MNDPDLNLLIALDALLAETSVTAAARRLGLSASAMSRTLTRLRSATGDKLLVRAGRGLVPTPRAIALRPRIQVLAREARDVLRPQAETVDPGTLERSFTIRASEAFLEFLSTSLVASVSAAAPGVSLHFVARPDKEAHALRDGSADLEIGLRGASAPEIRMRLLFRDRLVGLVRTGHPLLTPPKVTPERYAACRHVATAQEGHARDVDAALAALGLARKVMVVVPNYPDAMRIARWSDLVALVPRSCLGHDLLPDEAAVSGLAAFDLPVPSPEFVVSAMWHPRMDADPAHRWLREMVAALCRRAFPAR